MTTFVDTPLAHCPEQAILPSTPPPKQSNYLPSPPITPVYRRTVKRERGSQFEHLAAWDSTTPAHPTGSPVATVKASRHSTLVRPKTPRVMKPRSKTPATAKLSIRRKLVQSHAPPKRRIQKPTVAVPAPSPLPAKKPPGTGKNTKTKVKTEFADLAIINAHPFLQAAKAGTTTGRAKAASARPGKKAVTAGRGRPRGRVTNNSLSATLHPVIAKRKGTYHRSRVPGPGKICSSYYPSDRKLIPHPAGQRYHKGQPYLPPLLSHSSSCPVFLYGILFGWPDFRGACAREDCMGDSKATVNRHCISEYLQKGARGSSIPRPHRFYWCNKCYMRCPSIPISQSSSLAHIPSPSPHSCIRLSSPHQHPAPPIYSAPQLFV